MVFVEKFADGVVDLYADALAAAAEALADRKVSTAERSLAAISGELWVGTVRMTRSTATDFVAVRPRVISDGTRARVFIRDGFRCSYCGGRGIPRCVMVGISDVFPELFAYHANYARGRIHPAYWVLALEADHTVAHARGGPAGEDNLTAMHALCNTTKSAAGLDEVEPVERLDEKPGWSGLIPHYPGIVSSGNGHGRRHSKVGYHSRWLRRFGQVPLDIEANPPLGVTSC